jgi:hypothetical protein
MSYDFGIWKRSASTKTAMLAEAFTAISEGDAHPAIAPFDLKELEQALEAAFGEYKKDPESMICCDARSSEAGSWMIVQCSFPDAKTVEAKLVPIALELGLLLYDPQRGIVWGNKRVRS